MFSGDERMPKVAAEEFENLLTVQERKYKRVGTTIFVPSLFGNKRLENKLEENLQNVLGENWHIKAPAGIQRIGFSVLLRFKRPGYLINFEERTKHPYKMPKGTK